MAKIVISYRRADAPAMAGRVCDQLKTRYGAASVYMDIDSIPLGIDFRDHIHAALDRADVMVAIVGPRWLGPRRRNQPRIMEDNDLVRTEVEAALERKIPVVPILVDGAVMPESESLPDSIKSLKFRNSAVVDSGVDFHQHMQRVYRSLDRVLATGFPFENLLYRDHRLARVLVSIGLIVAVSATSIWLLIDYFYKPDTPNNRPDVGDKFSPPPGRSEWTVGKATVYLVPTGDKRQFFFIKPPSELTDQGAKPGSLLFDGKNIANSAYEGKLYVFAGRCGTRHYEASGPITNNDETVTLVGKAPRLDAESCEEISQEERTLTFNFKSIIPNQPVVESKRSSR